MNNFFHHLLIFTQNHFGMWGYIVLFLSSLFEGIPIIGVVIPGSSIAVGIGIFSKFSHIQVMPLIATGTIGAFLGDILGYAIGYTWGNEAVRVLGKWMFYTEERKNSLENFLIKHPAKFIIWGRFNTLARALSPMLFGVSKFNFREYCSYAFLSSFIWSVIHIGGGYIFGRAIQVALRYASIFVLFALAFSVLAYFLYSTINRNHHIFKKYYVYILGLNLFSAFAFIETYRQVIHHGWLTKIDLAVFKVIDVLVYSHITDFFVGLTALVDPINAAIFAAIFVFYMLYKKYYSDAILVALSFSLSTVVDLFLKGFTQIARPNGALVNILTTSFPSGHVTFATTFALLISIVFIPRLYINKKFISMCVIGILSFLFVILVGISRVYVRAHWVSDIIGGVFVGIFSVTLSMMLIRLIRLIHGHYARMIVKSEHTV